MYDVPQGTVLGPIRFVLPTHSVSELIDYPSVLHHMFADDTELCQSFGRSDINSLLLARESCVSYTKDWTLVNKLQLNEDKTEAALLLRPSYSAYLPASLQMGYTYVHFDDSARNLDAIFDNSLSMGEQTSKVCQSAHLELEEPNLSGSI